MTSIAKGNALIRDKEDPQHHTWQALFAPYKWFFTVEKKFLVILSRHRTTDGAIDKLEILKQDAEQSIEVDYLIFFQEFRAGKLQRTSQF